MDKLIKTCFVLHVVIAIVFRGYREIMDNKILYAMAIAVMIIAMPSAYFIYTITVKEHGKFFFITYILSNVFLFYDIAMYLNNCVLNIIITAFVLLYIILSLWWLRSNIKSRVAG